MDRQKGVVVPMNRRGFIAGLGALLVAPSIVRAGSIMPVSVSAKTYIVTVTYSGAWVDPKWVERHIQDIADRALATLTQSLETDFFRSMQSGTPGGYFLGDIVEMR